MAEMASEKVAAYVETADRLREQITELAALAYVLGNNGQLRTTFGPHEVDVTLPGFDGRQPRIAVERKTFATTTAAAPWRELQKALIANPTSDWEKK
jgi:hypothetical protein